MLIAQALHARPRSRRSPRRRGRHPRRPVRRPATRRAVVVTLLDALTAATSVAWQRGWQPSDVHRLAGRRLGVGDQALVVDVMSHELSRYAPTSVDHRWWAQLRELGGTVWWPTSSTPLDAHRELGVDWFTLISRALSVLHLIARLPVLELLTPLPGTAVPAAAPATGADGADQPAIDERILSRVRMLLAKAESTTFEAEAETFTAGAQSLMARHSIDAAVLAAADAAQQRVTRRPRVAGSASTTPTTVPRRCCSTPSRRPTGAGWCGAASSASARSSASSPTSRASRCSSPRSSCRPPAP